MTTRASRVRAACRTVRHDGGLPVTTRPLCAEVPALHRVDERVGGIDQRDRVEGEEA